MLDMVCAKEGIGIGYRGLDDHLVEDRRLMRVGQQIGRDGYGYHLVYRKEMISKRPFGRLRDFRLDPQAII
ncbi:MAG: LysR family glycine cleavage system transcriptional activator [Granulosicoccus sp.]|jgi:LysR family glycine cleavage system transcriptional activator